MPTFQTLYTNLMIFFILSPSTHSNTALVQLSVKINSSDSTIHTPI